MGEGKLSFPEGTFDGSGEFSAQLPLDCFVSPTFPCGRAIVQLKLQNHRAKCLSYPR
jgi:hypothetical protein